MFHAILIRRQILVGLFLVSCLLLTRFNEVRTDSPGEATRTPSEEARTLLLSADRVETIVVTARDIGGPGLGVEPVETVIGDFSLERLHSWITELKSISNPVAPGWGSDTIPTLCFVFYKNQKQVAVVGVDYGSSPNTSFREWKKNISYNIEPESAFTLRHIAARQPQFLKALLKAGAKAKDLAPKRAFQVKG